MKTDIIIENISDGVFYDINDMVKADTNGCEGCSACCHDVGDLVTLTPFDVYEIRKFLNITFEELLEGKLELIEENKISLPHLKMRADNLKCHFLDDNNRCEIHGHRPNICRLFPLARVYGDDDFKYILQVNACVKPKLSKIKVKKWIGIDHYKENKAFLLSWHQLIKALTFRLKFVRDSEEIKTLNELLIKTFYDITPDNNETFYQAYHKCLPIAKNKLGIL